MARFLNDRKKTIGKIPGSLIHIGTQKIDHTLIRLFNFTNEQLIENVQEKLEDCLPYISEDTISWISVYGLHNSEMIEKLGKLFGIHSLLLEDMLNTDQRPKIAETDTLMVVILKILDYDEKSHKINAEQISLILDESFLITLQEKEGHYFDSIRERMRKGTGRIRRKGADYLAYALIDTIVDDYLINIERFGSIIEETESRIFLPKQEGLIQEIYKHKTEINFLRKNIRPVKEIVHHLIENESGFVKEENLKYFHDLNDLIVQANETIEIYQTMLNDQMNLYHASLDNRANEIMKVLTLFSAFFIPMSFVAGVYGTNFDNIPELHLKYGFLYFWILMALIIITLVIYFKRRKWF